MLGSFHSDTAYFYSAKSQFQEELEMNVLSTI